MIPAPSGTGYGIILVVFVLVLLAGAVIVGVGVGSATRRQVADMGCLTGPILAAGWVWLLLRIDHWPLVAYALVLFGGPAAAVALDRWSRHRNMRRRSDG